MLSWAIVANGKLLSDILSFSSGDQVKALIDYAKQQDDRFDRRSCTCRSLKEKFSPSPIGSGSWFVLSVFSLVVR